MCLKRNTFETTNGAKSRAGTQLHTNGLINKTREEERSPDGDERKEAGIPPSNAQGVQNDKITEHTW